MKSYTDIEQSEKLAEILPLESTDMIYLYWINSRTKKEGIDDIPTIRGELPIQKCDIPCWSLAALLDVLPNDTYVVKEEADTENERYMCTVGVKDDIIPTFADNPVDACYEMILKLHEFNLL